jgi:dienelactone hydrolase
MAEVVLFHHVQGLTDGLRAFAEVLRGAGHTVHTPDLFDGARPPTLDHGVAHVQRTGAQALTARADRAVADLPAGLVHAGFSWGAGTAQRFAQTRPGARGALRYEACLPVTGEWALSPWPDAVPVQVHGIAEDPFFAGEGDLAVARELVETVGPDLAELFVYPGEQHLFSDSSLPSYDATAASLVLQRTLELLDRVG